MDSHRAARAVFRAVIRLGGVGLLQSESCDVVEGGAVFSRGERPVVGGLFGAMVDGIIPDTAMFGGDPFVEARMKPPKKRRRHDRGR